MNDADAWETRSRRNAAAAGLLLSKNASGLEGPAATRHYYALFQVVICELTAAKKRPADIVDKATRWRHDIVQSGLGFTARLRSCKNLDVLFDRLRTRRETADYGPGFVDPDDVREDQRELTECLRNLRTKK